tara:strand:+ start:7035 stop:7295 length:261 start_codon:yes stop_codon:yes gene_type:complete
MKINIPSFDITLASKEEFIDLGFQLSECGSDLQVAFLEGLGKGFFDIGSHSQRIQCLDINNKLGGVDKDRLESIFDQILRGKESEF